MRRTATASSRLRIDATRCDGVGICSLVAPDVVTLDQWGFPVIADIPALVASGQLEAEDAERQVRRAVRACPHRVLSS